jgi:hypothetical protein
LNWAEPEKGKDVAPLKINPPLLFTKLAEEVAG